MEEDGWMGTYELVIAIQRLNIYTYNIIITLIYLL